METTGRGWGMWCCSWMDVDGVWGMWCVGWGYMWMEDRRVGRIEIGGNLNLSVFAVCTNKPYHTKLLDNNEIT